VDTLKKERQFMREKELKERQEYEMRLKEE